MRKKLLGAIVFFISLILLTSLILYHMHYSKDLESRCDEIAQKRITSIYKNKLSMINYRLTNSSALVKRIAEYEEKGIKQDIPAHIKGNISYISIFSSSDLLFLETDGDTENLYQQLTNGETVFCSYLPENINQSRFYFIAPYFKNDTVQAVIMEYSYLDFISLLSINNLGYDADFLLIRSDGRIIDSTSQDITTSNLYSLTDFSEILPRITSEGGDPANYIFQYKQNKEHWYAYNAATTVNDLRLITLAPCTVLLGESSDLITLSIKFTTHVVLVLSLFFITIIGALYYYYYKNRSTRNTLSLEQNRHRLTLSYLNDSIWEYHVKTDTLTKTNPFLGIFIGQKMIPNFMETSLNSDLIHPDDIEVLRNFFSLCDSDLQEKFCEVRAKDEKGNYIWYEVEGSKLYDAENNLISIIGHTTNINDKKQEMEQLRAQAKEDSLTKLLNHAATENDINELIQTLEKPSIMAFMIIDIDNFKTINDSLGHLFGDAVLIDLSAKLKKLFRDIDILGRVGGDEFIVLMNDVPSMDFIRQKAFETCRIIRDIYIGDNVPFQVSGSIGISIFPADGTDFDSLYQKADTALYQAKYNGKDRFCFYSEDMPPISEQYSNLILQKYAHECSYPHEDRSLEDGTIIATAIDMLFDSREIDTSIHMVLSLIGTYFNLGRIDIFEFKENNTLISITHEWCSVYENRIINSIQNIHKENMQNYIFYDKGPDGLFYCDDLSLLLTREAYPDPPFIQQPTISLIQCGIKDHGRPLGFITVSVQDAIRHWSKNELNTISLLCKVIGTYLLRLRSMQKADLISQKDLLTGSYNLATFLSVANLLLQANREMTYAFFYIDIKDFKLFNDTYGFDAGDHILKSLADIYREVGGPTSILSRITGDKFVMMFSYTKPEELREKAEKILTMSKQIRENESEMYKFSITIGIYTTSPNEEAMTAVDRANIARKKALDKYNTGYAFFDEAMLAALIETKELEDEMESSLANGEFLVYYQPKVNINTLEVIGAEALVRWQRPNIGLIPPNSFLPLFENNGFIVDLDFYVLDQVCNFLRRNMNANKKVFPISVNFSREHFKSDEFPERLKSTVEKYRIPCSFIEIEITESAFPINDKVRIEMLNRIRSYGFLLAMDDFGTGQSSLHLLCDLPFDVLKIDKDFFHTRTTSIPERIVISNIVKMALELNMEVICEGVETIEQAHFLQSIGCFVAQGHFYELPMPEKNFEEKYIVY